MATVRKILGQHVPTAGNTDLMYTVPTSTQAVVSSIMCCNFSGASDSIIIAVVPSGDSITTANAIYYGLPIGANDTFTATVGITMGAGDMVYVYSLNGTVAYSLFGQEIT